MAAAVAAAVAATGAAFLVYRIDNSLVTLIVAASFVVWSLWECDRVTLPPAGDRERG